MSKLNEEEKFFMKPKCKS